MAELWAYIALEASEFTATHFLNAIEEKFETLRHAPDIGTKREMFALSLRVTFHRSYALYYTHTADELVIVRVLHSARDAAALADRGAFS